MPNTQALYARHRTPVGASAPVCAPPPPADAHAAVLAALAALEAVAARPAFTRPDGLTNDDVLDFALTLLRLRDSAHAASQLRLTQACDALSVTVARLIENCTPVRCDQCGALTRFVAHARAMLLMPPDAAARARAH